MVWATAAGQPLARLARISLTCVLLATSPRSVTECTPGFGSRVCRTHATCALQEAYNVDFLSKATSGDAPDHDALTASANLPGSRLGVGARSGGFLRPLRAVLAAIRYRN